MNCTYIYINAVYYIFIWIMYVNANTHGCTWHNVCLHILETHNGFSAHHYGQPSSYRLTAHHFISPSKCWRRCRFSIINRIIIKNNRCLSYNIINNNSHETRFGRNDRRVQWFLNDDVRVISNVCTLLRRTNCLRIDCIRYIIYYRDMVKIVHNLLSNNKILYIYIIRRSRRIAPSPRVIVGELLNSDAYTHIIIYKVFHTPRCINTIWTCMAEAAW